MRHLPALVDIARDPHPFVVIQKSAQVGVTELLVNSALWAADMAYAQRGHVLFLMPTANQMDDFAQSRFDRAIQDSPYLRGRLQPEPPRRKGADNKRLKHLGPGYIYLRGSESVRQIASVDADLVILDEYDQMAEGTLDLAQKRLASSRLGMLRAASTPRYPEAGINALYLQSDQQRYYLPCSTCGQEQPLTWEDNVDLERVLVVCRRCRAAMDVLTPGRWVATAPANTRIRGYHFSRLYSPWLDLATLIEASSATSVVGVQEFQNSDLGETFSPPGGRITLDILDRNRQSPKPPSASKRVKGQRRCFMGVDVGTVLNVVIREVVDEEEMRSRLVFAGELKTFAELDALAKQYDVEAGIIDERPETRLARAFCEDHDGFAVARYSRAEPGFAFEAEDFIQVVQINRTSELEALFHAFESQLMELPDSARHLGGRVKQGVGEYYRQLMALRRVLERDANGNWVSRFVDDRKADHYAHAELYCHVAIRHHSQMGPFFAWA